MPRDSESRYLICCCGVVYERTTSVVSEHEKGRFTCPCGTRLGAWNGIIRLIYQPVAAPDHAVLGAARYVAADPATLNP